MVRQSRAEYVKKWAEINKDKIREKKKTWRLENKEKIKERDKEYRFKNKDRLSAYMRGYRLKNKERLSEKNKRDYQASPYKACIRGEKWREDAKKTCLLHYSAGDIPMCSVDGCTVTDIDMLQIDHIGNNGSAHRKEIAGKRKSAGHLTYRWLIKNEFPMGFQVLCANHNIKKEIERRRDARISSKRDDRSGADFGGAALIDYRF